MTAHQMAESGTAQAQGSSSSSDTESLKPDAQASSDRLPPAPQTPSKLHSATLIPARTQPLDPIRSYVQSMRSHSERLLLSNDLAARTDFSRRLASGAAFFRALSMEMCTRANDLAPVSRLPREILVMIATILIVDDPIHPPKRLLSFITVPSQIIYYKGCLGWVKLTHVCRSWRAVLLGAHSLWARHVGILPNAMLTFLERAGSSAPVDFDTDLDPRLRVPSCQDMYTRLPLARMRSMIWHLSKVPDTTYIYHRLATSGDELSALERLHIHSTITPSEFAPDHIPARSQSLPSMRSLRLEQFYVPFVMPRLTELDLCRLTAPTQLFFNTLTTTPSLVRIRLEKCQFSSPPVAQAMQVELAKLQLLVISRCDISGHENINDWIGEHLQLPASAHFNLNLYIHYEDRDVDADVEERELISALKLCAASFARATHPPNIIAFDEGDIRLLTYDLPPSREDSVWQNEFLRGALLQAEVNYATRTIELESIFTGGVALHRILSFRFITVINICFAPYVPWEHIYPALPNVHTLRLNAQNQEPLEALGRIYHGGSENGSQSECPPLYLPRLQLLWVDDGVARMYPEERECTTQIRLPLLEMLKARHAVCVRLDAPASPRILYLQNFIELPD
ncbi:hypothetical protein PENSPDRAFT_736941 [Peniophora sp. CONT]|nr:hypothetical protein PENSPDRAFT_736941 [Peniophora sp. CONT]